MGNRVMVPIAWSPSEAAQLSDHGYTPRQVGTRPDLGIICQNIIPQQEKRTHTHTHARAHTRARAHTHTHTHTHTRA